jgi:hypothetical protein
MIAHGGSFLCWIENWPDHIQSGPVSKEKTVQRFPFPVPID